MGNYIIWKSSKPAVKLTSMKINNLRQCTNKHKIYTHKTKKKIPQFQDALKAIVSFPSSDITAKTQLNGLETVCCFILKLTYLNITNQVLFD